jgi:hypothetical protein
MNPLMVRLEDHQRRGEGRGGLSVAELESPFQKPNRRRVWRGTVPPLRVRARGDESDDKSATTGFLRGLLHPEGDGPAIRRVKENLVRCPGLREPVLFLGEEPRTLRVLWRGARVECEGTELSVEFGEGGGWGGMLVRTGRE